MMYLMVAAWSFLAGVFLVAAVSRWTHRMPSGEGIPLNSKCPACGHRGCTLEFRRGPEIVTDNAKGTTRTEESLIVRKCSTCGALAAEKCVLDPAKWIAK